MEKQIMMDRLELAAWLRDTGNHVCADELIDAAPDDAAAIAYVIADHIEEDLADPHDPYAAEGLPAQLRRWADLRESSSGTERGASASSG